MKELSYLELAKEAKSRGDHAQVWRCFKNYNRVQQKKWAKEKDIAALTANVRL